MGITKQKIHFRGKRVSFEEQQEFTYLQKYEGFHSLCGYLYLASDKKTYITDASNVTCKRCIRILSNLSKIS
jgi:hypothetical protein